MLTALLATATTMLVPASSAIADGHIRAGEYDGGFKVNLPNGEVRAAHKNGDLFIGINPRKSGIASVFLLNGKRLTVLHSSAALGTAEYEVAGDTLKCTRKFKWDARPGRTPEETATGQDAFWKKEKWMSNSIDDPATSSRIREFRISLSLVTSKSTRMFIAYDDTASNALQIGYPAKAGCSSALLEVIRGYERDLKLSDTADWAVLELGQ